MATNIQVRNKNIIKNKKGPYIWSFHKDNSLIILVSFPSQWVGAMFVRVLHWGF